MGRHLNPRPNAAVSNVNVPAVAVVTAAQSDTRWMRRTAPRQPSVPTGCTRREGCAVNSRSTATAAAPRAPRKRKERRPGPMRHSRSSTNGWRQWLLRPNLATPTTRRTRSPGKPPPSAANCRRWNLAAARGVHGRHRPNSRASSVSLQSPECAMRTATAGLAQMSHQDRATMPCRAACGWTCRSAGTTAASTPWPVCSRTAMWPT